MKVLSVSENGKLNERQDFLLDGSPFKPSRRVNFATSASIEKQYATLMQIGGIGNTILPIFSFSADELVARYGAKIYDEMMADAMIAGILRDIVTGVVTNTPYAVAVDESPQSLAMASWVDRSLRYMAIASSRSSVDLFRHILRDTLAYGHCVAEMVFDEVEIGEKPAYILRKLFPIPVTRYSFRFTPEGDFLGVVPFRLPYGTASFVTQSGTGRVIRDDSIIPSAKLVYLSWDRTSNSPIGRSILRAAFKPWAIKKEIEEHMLNLAKRIRKAWLGVLPGDARKVCITDPQTGQQETIDPRQDMLDVLQSLANGDGGVVPSGSDVRAYDIEISGAGQYFIELHKLMNREILRAIYSRMMANNNDAAASTTGEFDRGMTAKAIKSVRSWYEDSLNALSYSMCFFAFGEAAMRYAPRIVVGRGDGIPTTIQEIALLHQSGWFTRSQKRMIDDEMGMPPDDNGEIIGPYKKDVRDEQRERPRDDVSAG